MSDFNYLVKYLSKDKKVYAIICEEYEILKRGLLCEFEDGSTILYEDFLKILDVEKSGD